MPRFKSFKRSRRDGDSDGEGSDVEAAKPQKVTKKAKTGTATVSAAGQKDAEGNSFWPITATRRVVVSEFKGKPMVSIREYYTDNAGDLKPGKKGITLPIDQWNAVLNAIPQINGELAAQGHEVAGIQGGPAPSAASAEGPTVKEKRKNEKARKANIEATSDESDSDTSG